MPKFKILFFLLSYLPAFLSGQNIFQKNMGTPYADYAADVKQTPFGQFITAGYTYDPADGAKKAFLMQTNDFGETEWAQTYGGSYDDWGETVLPTANGGYIMAGGTKSFGQGDWDVYVVKTDEFGNPEWSKTYGGPYSDFAEDIQATVDGGYIITGWTSSFGNGGWDIYLIKTDGDGNMQWTKTFGGDNLDKGLKVKGTSDGGYIITGGTFSFGAGSWDVYVVKTDALGNKQWSRTYGGTGEETGYDILEKENFFYITGNMKSFGNGDHNAFLLKINSAGDTVWNRIYGSAYDELAYFLSADMEGFTIIGESKENVYILKTDTTGHGLWAKEYGDYYVDNAYGADALINGGYVMAGITNNFTFGSSDIYLLSTNNAGDMDCRSFDGDSIYVDSLPEMAAPADVAGSGGIAAIAATATELFFIEDTLACAISAVADADPIEIEIFPNPADNVVMLKVSGAEAAFNYRLLNVLGQEVNTGEVIPGDIKTLNISGMPAGIYFIEITAGAGKERYIRKLAITQ